MLDRQDPYGVYNYKVQLKGIISGGFSEVSGLSLQTEVEDFKEGGVNDFVYKLPKGTTYTDLTLKRGLVDLDLWDWYWDIVKGTIKRLNVTISLCDDSGDPIISWDYLETFPIKWEGPQFNGKSSEIATETLILTHHGLIVARKG
jgi:phage tail-like protein